MVSKRSIDAVVAILNDPENQRRTAEEVADLIFDEVYPAAVADAKAEVRSDTRREIIDRDATDRRLAVVGQIQFRPQEETHTVILGPFSCRGILDDPVKFRRAVEGGSAARTAGQGLAWDPKTQVSRGRFMLAPAFMRPRDAWDFFRANPEEHLPRFWRVCKGPADYLRIAEQVAQWEPGKWAERNARERDEARGD